MNIMNYRNWGRRLAVVTALAAGGIAAALFASAPAVQAQQAGVDEAARALLPEAIKKAGVLRVGLEINFAPWMYQNNANEAEGIDPDFIRAIAAKLGVKPEFTFAEFPALLPGVQSGRFDFAGNYANTAERRKAVSFVNYVRYAGGMLVQKGNPHKVNVKNLCGVRVSSGVGSFQQANEQKLSEICVKEGKPPVNIVILQQAEALAALRADRVDAADMSMAMNAYLASLPGSEGLEALEGSPTIAVEASVIGYITSKDPDGVALSKALAAAFNALIKDGQYAANFKKWKLPDEAKLKEAYTD